MCSKVCVLAVGIVLANAPLELSVFMVRKPILTPTSALTVKFVCEPALTMRLRHPNEGFIFISIYNLAADGIGVCLQASNLDYWCYHVSI